MPPSPSASRFTPLKTSPWLLGSKSQVDFLISSPDQGSFFSFKLSFFFSVLLPVFSVRVTEFPLRKVRYLPKGLLGVCLWRCELYARRLFGIALDAVLQAGG